MSLKDSAIRGVKYTTVSLLASTGILTLQTLILTRILPPSVFGQMAILTIVVGFSQAFMDMGISNAIIQRQQVSAKQLSSLFWLNVLSGIVVCVVVASLAPVVGAFYKTTEIVRPLQLLSLVFIIVALGNQYRVLNQKGLHFHRNARIEISSAVLSLLTSTSLAYLGMGLYSLVIAMLVQASLSTSLYVISGIHEHRPTWYFKKSDLRDFVSFGLYQMAEKIVNYMSAQMDKVLIGKFLGMETLGYYSLAWQLIIFPLSKINPVVNKVAFPIYSKIQDDTERLNRYYSISIKTLSLLTIPLLAFLSVFSTDVVSVLYGDKWLRSAFLVSVLAGVGMSKAIANPGGALIMSKGRPDVGFWWNVVWLAATTVTIGGGIYWGGSVEAVALGMLGLAFSVGMFWHVLVAKIGGADYHSLIPHVLKILLVSFLIGILVKVIVGWLPLPFSIARLGVEALCFGGLYLVFVGRYERFLFDLLKRGK